MVELLIVELFVQKRVLRVMSIELYLVPIEVSVYD